MAETSDNRPVSEEPRRQPPAIKHAPQCNTMTGNGGGVSQNIIILPKCNCGAEEPRREEPDKLLRIAGLVNGYHNDGTKLSAADTLAAIADVLGDPFDFSSSAVVVGADQQLIAKVLRLAHWEPGDDLQALRTRLACIGAAAVDFSLALPDPGVGADQQERTYLYWQLRVEHARKQGAADGFQAGWHAALRRVADGDDIAELTSLVPSPALPDPGSPEREK
jgi:hypothetical protein